MHTEKRLLVLIRTRPLGQGNYGGILQAYALQETLLSLGFDSITDVSLGPTTRHGARWLQRVKSAIKGALTRLGARSLVRPGWIASVIRTTQDEAVQRFVTERVQTMELFDKSGRVNASQLDRFHLFLTGSDQVWRAAFGRVPTYLFDFLPSRDTRPKIAYAASFGTTEVEFTPDLIAQTRGLAQGLDHVSVRESSAVELARRLWGIEAVHVLDPTLLLEASQYSALVDGAAAPTQEGGLVSYVLDDHSATQTTVADAASKLGLVHCRLLPPTPSSYREYRRNPHQYLRPGVENWLGLIRDASFVITDSFHGTVFAIMFNRPFVAIVNRERGSTRFESLLELFGLEHRLIEPGTKAPLGLLESPIDWDRVNNKIVSERDSSLGFLRGATQPMLPDGVR